MPLIREDVITQLLDYGQTHETSTKSKREAYTAAGNILAQVNLADKQGILTTELLQAHIAKLQEISKTKFAGKLVCQFFPYSISTKLKKLIDDQVNILISKMDEDVIAKAAHATAGQAGNNSEQKQELDSLAELCKHLEQALATVSFDDELTAAKLNALKNVVDKINLPEYAKTNTALEEMKKQVMDSTTLTKIIKLDGTTIISDHESSKENRNIYVAKLLENPEAKNIIGPEIMKRINAFGELTACLAMLQNKELPEEMLLNTLGMLAKSPLLPTNLPPEEQQLLVEGLVYAYNMKTDDTNQHIHLQMKQAGASSTPNKPN